MSTTCTRCDSRVEPEDLRCVVCGLPTPAPATAEPDPELARILRCLGCNAAVSYDIEARAPRCTFCREPMELEVPDQPVGDAEHYLNFRVTPKAARAALRAWLGNRGWLAPRDLQSKATLARFRPVWWAGWLFDADVLMHWAADSDHGSRRADWAPHSGHAQLELERVVVSGSRGLHHREAGALVPAYNLNDRSPTPRGPKHATRERFAMPRSAAGDMVTGALATVARRRARAFIPGRTFRKLHVSVLPTRLDSRRYAFPAYVLAYRYGRKLHRVIVHGQDASVVVGDAPRSAFKILAIVGLIAALATVLTLLASS